MSSRFSDLRESANEGRAGLRHKASQLVLHGRQLIEAPPMDIGPPQTIDQAILGQSYHWRTCQCVKLGFEMCQEQDKLIMTMGKEERIPNHIHQISKTSFAAASSLPPTRRLVPFDIMRTHYCQTNTIWHPLTVPPLASAFCSSTVPPCHPKQVSSGVWLEARQ